MDFNDFLNSLKLDSPPPSMPDLIKSLWYDKKGFWNKAHNLADGMPGSNAAWVHAYLHRKEGDDWNANYWYRRAGKTNPNSNLEEEWTHIVKTLLPN